MALVKAEDIGNQIEGINKLPVLRQVGLMVALAATVALAVAIVLWAQEPNYKMLYGNLSDQEMLEISSALDQAGIRYDINASSSSIMVESGRIHDARMRLASSGLPKGADSGYALLDKDQGFGTSQFIETARYQRAIEGELSKTIASVNNIQSARVHLAIPKQSAFVRNRKSASASVMLNLYQGRRLNEEQAASIAHLVASSVPSLEMEDVTVVDQNGRMLTRSDASSAMGKSSSQFEYRQKLEEYYIHRIEEILEPVVGVGKLKAQVMADLDFTITEQTNESFNPDLPSIRSEQTIEEEVQSGVQKGGIPGAMANQPPGAGAMVMGDDATGQGGSGSSNNSRRVVRNYELDRTVSHTKYQTGMIKRISTAIVIDNRFSEDGTSTPLTAEEMEKINGLVKEAIGFNVARGDSLNIINAEFQPIAEAEPLPETSFLDQPWLWDAAKQGVGLVVVLFLIFGVLKPALKNLAEKGAAVPVPIPTMQDGDQLAIEGQPGAQPGQSYQQALDAAKSVAQQEPQRVAGVVKEWVAKDGG